MSSDHEPYGPGDSEYRAGQRLLARVRHNLGARFIHYVVVDGEFATAPFLHAAGKAGWPVVARLKENLPELLGAAEQPFRSRPSILEFRNGTDRPEIWDANDFDPWQSFQRETVRVLRYRHFGPLPHASQGRALRGTAGLRKAHTKRTKNSRQRRLVRGDLPLRRPGGAAANQSDLSEK